MVVSVVCMKWNVLFLFISAASKVLSFFNKDARGEVQTVTFDNDVVKKIFYGSFHKVKDWNYDVAFWSTVPLNRKKPSTSHCQVTVPGFWIVF